MVLTYLCHVTVLSPGSSAQSHLQVISGNLSLRLKAKSLGIYTKQPAEDSRKEASTGVNYEGRSKLDNTIHS